MIRMGDALRKIDGFFHEILSLIPKDILITIGASLIIDSLIGFATKSVSKRLLSGSILYYKDEYYWILALGEILIGLYIILRMWILDEKISNSKRALERKREFFKRFNRREKKRNG